jgi:plastocyanin
MASNTHTDGNTTLLKWSVIIAIALVAFFGSYRFAIARGNAAQASPVAQAAVAGTPAQGASAVPAAGGSCCGSGGSAASGSASGGCCGGGATKQGPAVTKKAAVAGGVQKISVDLSKGSYDPDTIQLKAGVPAEITFGQSAGCTGIVQSQQLGFSEDLSGGPKTVKLAALQPGTYQFACGMNMVTGTIVVK